MQASAKLELFKVFVSDDAHEQVGGVLRSGTLTQGPRVDEFEASLQSFIGGNSHVVTVNSATSALQLALRVLKEPYDGSWPGLVPGDTVLTPALTCWAATCSILNEGLVPAWIDADTRSGSVSLADIDGKLTKQTKVVEVMHWGGTPVDVQELDRILDAAAPRLGFRPMVIEDCAHAFGARYPDGRLVGTSGNICVWSFQAIKILTCGDGGAVVLPDTPHGRALNSRCRLLRWFGIDRDRRKAPAADGTDFRLEGDVDQHGGKFHMNDYNATLGLSNLPHVAALVELARENTRQLRQGLSELNHVRYLGSDAGEGSSCWLFSVWVRHKPEFLRLTAARGIVSSQVHRRNDVHSCVAHCAAGPLWGIDHLDQHLTCLPCGWWIDSDGISRIIEACLAYEEVINISGCIG